MKKHEVILDFTSLLDVILIILFLVLCTMNGKAAKDAEKIDELTEATVTMGIQLEEQSGEIKELTEKNKELEDKLSELQALYDSLNHKYGELFAENEYHKGQAHDALQALQTSMEINGMSQTDLELFQLFKDKSITLELRLVKVDKKRCDIGLYSGGKRFGTEISIDPDKNAVEANGEKIANWLSSLLKRYVSDKNYSMALMAVTYDNTEETGVAKSAHDAVTEGLLIIDRNASKGYDLFHTDKPNNGTK